MKDQDEEEIIFWMRMINGQRGFRREDGIDSLGVSGPMATKLFHRVKQLITLLEHRNDWALCISALNPAMEGILREPPITRFVFEKFDREFVISFNAKEGRWSLGLLPSQQPPQAGAASNPPPPPNAGGGPGSQSAEAQPIALPPAPKPPAGDEYRPISAAPRRARGNRASRTGFLWRAFDAAQRSPRFRHIGALWKRAIAQAESALRQVAGQAQKALLLALGEDDRAGNHSVTRLVHLVQERRFGAVFEPQVVERAGRTFTVWTFSEHAKPKWELWLFGRLIEDEQIAV